MYFYFHSIEDYVFLTPQLPSTKKKEKGIRVNGLTKDFELLPNAIHG